MNREDIIRMAREAEFQVIGQRVFSPVIEGSDLAWLLERFAALVIAAEREACETIADAEASSWGGFDSGFTASVNIAAAIRARRNT